MVAKYNPIATMATMSAVRPWPLLFFSAINCAETQLKFQLWLVAHQTYGKQLAQPMSTLGP